VTLVEVRPQPPPAGMPVYAKASDIPPELYELEHSYDDGVPMTFTLKTASVIGGVPCAASPLVDGVTVGRDGKVRHCVLEISSRLSGLDLQPGTRVGFLPTGELSSLVLPDPQLVAGIPIQEGTFIELTPPPLIVPMVAPLAADYTALGTTFPSDSLLVFDAADPAHPLASARLAAPTKVEGTEYPAGVRLLFDPQGRITRVDGIARPPDAPLGCPSATTVTVESTAPGYPAGLAWSSIPYARVDRGGMGGDPVIAANSDATLVLANFDREATARRQPGEAAPGLSEGQGILFLEISRVRGRRLQTGTYAFGPPGEFDWAFDARIGVPGDSGTAVRLDPATAQGELELTMVGAYRLCGNIDLRDAQTHIRGEFSVWSPVKSTNSGSIENILGR
jgi:hypothetical protein